MTVRAAQFRAWIVEAGRLVDENAERLTALDAAIGDGDHGINLRRGFQAAVAALEEPGAAAPGPLLQAVGRALISKTGGASGPLYGMAFRQAGKVLGTDEDVSPERLGAALAAALAGIQQLGGAMPGDKTMVDALQPAVAAYHQALAGEGDLAAATAAAAEAADRAVGATAALTARKGRASYLGERAVGQQDPGAASSALILRALAAVAQQSTVEPA